MSRRILVVEDNVDLARLVSLHLRDLGCQVESVDDGAKALARARAGDIDLIVLDLMLPGMDGLELCRQLRGERSYTPILMLTAKSSELDRVVGLEVGADDYLTKPFSVRELLARVKAIFRRMEAIAGELAPGRPLRFDGLHVDPDRREVRLEGRPVDLTAKEFDLLVQFASHPGRVYTRSQLLDLVWGYSHSGYEHTVNSHINRLRRKLEEETTQPRYILTVWGVGYKFNDALA